MNKNELINDIRKYCKENTNAENIVKYAKYFKEAPASYGLSAPQLRSKTKELLTGGNLSLKVVLEAMPEFLKTNMSEEITLGLLLIDGFEKQYTPELFRTMNEWFTYSIHNWAHADTLAMFILARFLKLNIIREEDLSPWLNSPHKFQRRCVPVALIKTLKTRDNYSGLFTILEPLMTDTEREVHQGMGWFLRECWKKKPRETEDFLLKWKDKAPRLIIQYATERMTAQEKLLYRKAKG